MLDYAGELTRRPSNVKKKYIEKLKDEDFSDKDILVINQVVSYFNYVNRIVEGLGVTLETQGGN